MIPAFFGLAGTQLTEIEEAFFKEAGPAGYILFSRNIDSRAQVSQLCDSLKALHSNPRLPILIDQEGGRVARLRPPVSPEFPPAAHFGALFETDPQAAVVAARANAKAIALDLAALGITVNCLPLLDVPAAGSHDIIGDRAFASDPAVVATLGTASLLGLHEGGIVGVIKHIPGHGRALSDSHLELPRVDATLPELSRDTGPFRALQRAPMAMTAHVVYPAWDADHCATHSKYIIESVIRQQIGFTGLLMSDDLGMHALQGDFGTRTRLAYEAGCDIILHCSGDMGEMQAVAAALPAISLLTRGRLQRAMAWPYQSVTTLA